MSGFGSQPRKTQAPTIPEPLVIGPWPKGINTVARNDALMEDELAKAVGVVVDKLGVLHAAGVLRELGGASGVFYTNSSVTVLAGANTVTLFNGALGAAASLPDTIRCVVPIPEGFLVSTDSELVFIDNKMSTYYFGKEVVSVSAGVVDGGKLAPGEYLVAAAEVGPFGYTHAAVASVVIPSAPEGVGKSIAIGGASHRFLSNSGDKTLMACADVVDDFPVNVEFYPYLGCRATVGSGIMAVVAGRLAVAQGSKVTFSKPFNYQVTDDSDAYEFGFDIKYMVATGSDLYVCGSDVVVSVVNCMSNDALMSTDRRVSVLPNSYAVTDDGVHLVMTTTGLMSLDGGRLTKLNDRVSIKGITESRLISCGEYVYAAATQEAYRDGLQFVVYLKES